MRSSSNGSARLAGVLIASVWLAISIGVGIWLIVATPGGSTKFSVRSIHLTAASQQQSYGGDAYTGIQNAASDTEHAVVDGVNVMTDTQVALARSSAEQRHDIAAHIAVGLGALVIGVGVANFTQALRRSSVT